ncbi:hypothetical protein LWC34_44415 [Kibdelosporangium philippinense]|uniref:Uncharacterized protein n=1 Tax=Kibdelosporangium philippinense TaxID=211113 RepID=A0ABS8ZPY0_9PSEU|nr:hypothetical protein [Kibdelosporangium philippinense]MCE7009810.1 hypothetical protein [Kibdelosporangium philippinense]
MSTEEKIKQAFERQAGRAGDHRAVLAEVRKATAKRRISGWGMGLISIGVAAAVATPIVLSSAGQPYTAPPADPMVTTLPAAPVPEKPAEHAGEGVTVLQYRPTWLPDGAYEVSRMFAGESALMRIWELPGSETANQRTLRLLLSQAAMPTVGKAVDINGIPGMLVTDHQETSVTWMVEPGQRLSVIFPGTDEVADIALRVARSVKPDGDAAFVWPLEFQWLPEHLQPSGFTVHAIDLKYVDVSASAQTIPREAEKGVSVSIFTLRPPGVPGGVPPYRPEGGTPVTVRGKQGVFVSGEVYVEFELGRAMVVSGPLSQQDLVRIADSIKIGPLNYPWIGTR